MNEDMVSYYARRAAEYERIYARPERQRDIGQLRLLCGKLFQGLEVLEISCGTGYWTEAIAPAAASVVACDINEAVLEIARGKEWRSSRIEFRQADSFALPDFGKAFSGGFSGFWWSHVPKEKLSSFLAGFHARLEKGALVTFIDNRYVEGNSTAICRTDSSGNSYQRRGLDDGSKFEVLKNFPSREELEAAVGGVSKSVDIRFLDYYWVVSYRTK